MIVSHKLSADLKCTHERTWSAAEMAVVAMASKQLYRRLLWHSKPAASAKPPLQLW